VGGYCDDVVVSATRLTDLQDRAVYAFGQVDRILGTKSGT
jgi:hypothetical protein